MNLLLIGAGKCQIPAIEEAHKLNLKVFGIDGNPKAEGLEKCDWNQVGDIKDLDWIERVALEKNKEIGLDGVMTLGVECAESVGRVVDKLGLIGVCELQAYGMTDKILRREILAEEGINHPRLIDRENPLFPYIIKPRRGSAAEGVKMVKSVFEEEETEIAEEYIEGHQLNTETIVLTPNLYYTYISDRNYPWSPPHKQWAIEDGVNMPSTIDIRTRQKVGHVIGKIIKAFDLDKCILKCDLIVKDNLVYVLECVPRLSGGRFCSHTVPMSLGVEMVNIAVRMAMGMPVHPKELIPTKNCPVAQRYIFPKGKEIKSHRDRGEDFICTGKTIEEAIANCSKAIASKN